MTSGAHHGGRLIIPTRKGSDATKDCSPRRALKIICLFLLYCVSVTIKSSYLPLPMPVSAKMPCSAIHLKVFS